MSSHSVTVFGLLMRGNTDMLVDVDGNQEGTPLLAALKAGPGLHEQSFVKELSKMHGPPDSRFDSGSRLCPGKNKHAVSYRGSRTDGATAAVTAASVTAGGRKTYPPNFRRVRMLRPADNAVDRVLVRGRLARIRHLLVGDSVEAIDRVVSALAAMVRGWHPCPVSWKPARKRKAAAQRRPAAAAAPEAGRGPGQQPPPAEAGWTAPSSPSVLAGGGAAAATDVAAPKRQRQTETGGARRRRRLRQPRPRRRWRSSRSMRCVSL